ncbi:MAG: M12 family metallo-peptidase [Pyrinomonadaceae bacterium]
MLKLDNKVVLDKAKSAESIEFSAYGRDFQFVLTPHDLRGINYRAVETTDSGERELPSAAVTTYRGKLSDDADSEVRLTVTDRNFEGFIYTGGERFFVAQAANFSKRAQRNDVIVYGEGDLIRTIDLSNDVETEAVENKDIEAKIDFGLDLLKGYIYGADETPEVSAAATAEVRVVEVATEADYQWVTQAGGASAANSEILGILNLVDGIYRRDLSLSVTVTYQHAWSSSDPYSTASSSALLDAFLNYWNANYPHAQYPRDTAHLFTGKFGNQGIAYQGVICRSPTYSYGLTARSGGVNHLITAHEIGHNLNAEHVVTSTTCPNSIMNPTLTSSTASFCQTSKTQVQNYVAANSSCLSVIGGTATPTPTPIATPTPIITVATLTASSSTVAAGGRLNVSFSGVSSPSTTDWIGVYNVGASDSSYLSYVYTSSGTQTPGSTALSAGTVSVTFPTTPGLYELRLNRNNGFTRIAISSSITVLNVVTATPTPIATPNVTPTPVATPTPTTGAATVSASSSTVAAGGTLNVTWSGVTSPTTTDWIGIFPIGAADYGYLSYIYTSSGTPSPGSTASSAGTASMSFPTTPGVYELRLNRNNGAVRVATSAQITVTTTTTGAATVSASSSTVAAGGTLNVTWSEVTSPTTTDWIGIFPIGAADYGYLSYIYTSSGTPSPGSTASSAGTASMSFPTTPGVYELRLNRNNGAVRVATSAQITVR